LGFLFFFTGTPEGGFWGLGGSVSFNIFLPPPPSPSTHMQTYVHPSPLPPTGQTPSLGTLTSPSEFPSSALPSYSDTKDC